MKKIELSQKPLKALRALALKLGVKNAMAVRKDDLISEILAAEKILKRKAATGKANTVKNSRSKVTSRVAEGKSSNRARTSTPKRLAAPELKETPSSVVEHKFEAPPHSPAAGSLPYDNLGELPEAYGTGRLFFAARDPHWIYSYWDYTWQQLEGMRRVARYGELKLRVYNGRDPSARLIQEITLNPASQNWFIKVDRANADYCAELGYYNEHNQFIAVSRSKPTRTPPDRLSDRTDARFVTIPFHITFRELFEMVKAYFVDGEELADVLYRLQAAGFRFPFDYPGAMTLPEQSLTDMFGNELFRRIRMGSEVITEWMHRRFREDLSSGLFAVSSPMGSSFGAPTSRGFWFKVNAELIVYGATDPKARVVFNGKEIALKSDGTFRFQFALPDGTYKVPVAATSPDGVETREVYLEFVRDTVTRDDVGVVPHSGEKVPPPPKS